MYEITLSDLLGLDKPKPKSKLPNEPRPFRERERHLTPPQFLDELGQIHSARKASETVTRAGPDQAGYSIALEAKKLQAELRFARYNTRFLQLVLTANHD